MSFDPQDDSSYSASSSSSSAAATMGMFLEAAASTQNHGVRLQIPQYMQSGAPMLAPGGGAEVLPVGLFNGTAGAGSSWYSNNGIIDNFSSDSYAKTVVYPSHPVRATPSNPASYESSGSPFDYTEEKPSSSLSQHINSGLINPQNRLTFRQLDAIGAGAGPSLGSSSLNAPSPLRFPIYSRTGFDLLSVLARVAARPDPKIQLGPVDLSSSFVVVDVRRYDHPIIYCSPSFCRLTGYADHEVLGKNCRFLQSPNGIQPKGAYRQFTSNEAVSHLKKHLVGDKECQTSIINYRKSGEAFLNLVTVIPIKGGDITSPQEDDKVIYHVGFQVDLTEQPNAILQKLKDGSYISDYAANNPVSIVPPALASSSLFGGAIAATGAGLGGPGGGGGGMNATMHTLMSRDRKIHILPPPAISRHLKKLLDDPVFMAKYPITTSTNADNPTSGSTPLPPPPESDLIPINPLALNHPLSLLLLENAPDFVHVVSLKGTFLYVGPSVRRVLGYEPEELVGKALADICHPADLVPVMRELKESSATGAMAMGSGSGGGGGGSPNPANGGSPILEDIVLSRGQASNQALSSVASSSIKPRPVDLLFRAYTKSGQYVWVECRGRLHVEPGKGRKAIMLSGRAKEMSMLSWSAIASTGGLSPLKSMKLHEGSGSPKSETIEVCTEFWGTITRAGTFLVVGKGVKDVLGWDETQLMGRSIYSTLLHSNSNDDDVRARVDEEIRNMGCAVGSRDAPGSLPRKMYCRMTSKGVDGEVGLRNVEMVLYPASRDDRVLRSAQVISPAPVIYQIKTLELEERGRPSSSLSLSSPVPHTSASASGNTPVIHPLNENVFKELEIVPSLPGQPWQYELQQLRIQNERLREDIRVIEEEVEQKQQKQQQQLREWERERDRERELQRQYKQPVKVQTQISHHPQMNAFDFDHHLHPGAQGMTGQAQTVFEHGHGMMYPTSSVNPYSSLPPPPPHPYSHSHSLAHQQPQAQVWSSSSSSSNHPSSSSAVSASVVTAAVPLLQAPPPPTPTAIAVKMPFVAPGSESHSGAVGGGGGGGTSARYDVPMSVSMSVPMKRPGPWNENGLDRNGNGIT